MKTSTGPCEPPVQDSFWHCQHCSRVVTPSAGELERAENASLYSAVKLKCPYCHKHTVTLKFPTLGPSAPVRRKEKAVKQAAASRERLELDPAWARAQFANMFAAIEA